MSTNKLKISQSSILSSKLINILKQNKNGISDNRLKNELGTEYEELCPIINNLIMNRQIEIFSKPGIGLSYKIAKENPKTCYMEYQLSPKNEYNKINEYEETDKNTSGNEYCDMFETIIKLSSNDTESSSNETNNINFEHRASCHRCGNIRKTVHACVKCPQIFCLKCFTKMQQEHGQIAFQEGCPLCKELCCCANRTTECARIHHCYKKCPCTKSNLSSPAKGDLSPRIARKRQTHGSSTYEASPRASKQDKEMKKRDSGDLSFRSDEDHIKETTSPKRTKGENLDNSKVDSEEKKSHTETGSVKTDMEKSLKNISYGILTGSTSKASSDPFYFQSPMGSFLNGDSNLPSMANLDSEKFGFYRDEDGVLLKMPHNLNYLVPNTYAKLSELQLSDDSSSSDDGEGKSLRYDKYTLCDELHKKNSDLLQRLIDSYSSLHSQPLSTKGSTPHMQKQSEEINMMRRKSELKSCIFDSFLADSDNFSLLQDCVNATPLALNTFPDEISTIGTIGLGLKTPGFDHLLNPVISDQNKMFNDNYYYNDLTTNELHLQHFSPPSSQLNQCSSISYSVFNSQNSKAFLTESQEDQFSFGSFSQIDCSPILFESKPAKFVAQPKIKQQHDSTVDKTEKDSCNFLTNELLNVLDNLYDKSQQSGTTFDCTEISSAGLDNLIEVCEELINSNKSFDECCEDLNMKVITKDTSSQPIKQKSLFDSSKQCFDNSIFENDDAL